MRVTKCREASCGALIAFVASAKTAGKFVPVDLSSLSKSEQESGSGVVFDRAKGHVSHYTTCKAPRQFSKSAPPVERRKDGPE